LAIGDLNGDGFGDLVLGAPGTDNPTFNSGSAYVIFSTLIEGVGATKGNNKPLATLTNFSNQFDGSSGAILTGEDTLRIGDVNSDGIPDLVLGGRAAANNGNLSGSTWVIFGSPPAAPPADPTELPPALASAIKQPPTIEPPPDQGEELAAQETREQVTEAHQAKEAQEQKGAEKQQADAKAWEHPSFLAKCAQGLRRNYKDRCEEMIKEEGYEASVFSHEGTVYVNELFLYQGEAARVGPDGLPAVHPRALYLTHTEGVSVIRTMTHELLRDFEWDEVPSDVLASKDGKTVYALLSESQRLGVLGTLALEKRGYHYGLEKGAGDIVLGRDGTQAFIANALADSIQVIDFKTREIIKTFSTGSMPSQILLTADGRTLFVSNRLDKTISKLNAQTGEEEKVIPVGGSPFGLVLSKNEEKLFVADTANDKVLVYDTQNFNRLGEIEVGRAPHVFLQPRPQAL